MIINHLKVSGHECLYTIKQEILTGENADGLASFRS